MGISEDEHQIRNGLEQRGIRMFSEGPGDPYWKTESGHSFTVSHYDPADHRGRGDGDPAWHLAAWHFGDPNATYVHARLGHDADAVPDKVMKVFRDREFMGHLHDQYNRARVNNNPTGVDDEAARESWASAPPMGDVVMDKSHL